MDRMSRMFTARLSCQSCVPLADAVAVPGRGKDAATDLQQGRAGWAGSLSWVNPVDPVHPCSTSSPSVARRDALGSYCHPGSFTVTGCDLPDRHIRGVHVGATGTARRPEARVGHCDAPFRSIPCHHDRPSPRSEMRSAGIRGRRGAGAPAGIPERYGGEAPEGEAPRDVRE